MQARTGHTNAAHSLSGRGPSKGRAETTVPRPDTGWHLPSISAGHGKWAGTGVANPGTMPSAVAGAVRVRQEGLHRRRASSLGSSSARRDQGAEQVPRNDQGALALSAGLRYPCQQWRSRPGCPLHAHATGGAALCSASMLNGAVGGQSVARLILLACEAQGGFCQPAPPRRTTLECLGVLHLSKPCKAPPIAPMLSATGDFVQTPLAVALTPYVPSPC